MRKTLTVVFLSLLLTAQTGGAWALLGGSAKLKVGDDAPGFKGPLLRGGEFDTAPHVGANVILLDFWSIYCVACVQEMPKLVEIHNRYREQGLVTVGVDLDSFGTKRVKRFVKGLKFEVTYPILVDKRRTVASKYGVSVLPTTVVIDRAGKVIYYHVGYSPGDEVKIEDTVRQALGMSAQAGAGH
jgi:peroxiredoxin